MKEQKEKQQQWQKGSMPTVQALQMYKWGAYRHILSSAGYPNATPHSDSFFVPFPWQCHFADPYRKGEQLLFQWTISEEGMSRVPYALQSKRKPQLTLPLHGQWGQKHPPVTKRSCTSWVFAWHCSANPSFHWKESEAAPGTSLSSQTC